MFVFFLHFYPLSSSLDGWLGERGMGDEHFTWYFDQKQKFEKNIFFHFFGLNIFKEKNYHLVELDDPQNM